MISLTKALLQNTFREIAHTKARFISIMAIIALGVGFFAGIKATSPSMYHLAETYYRDKRLMDFRLVSTNGISEDDIAAVRAVEGVQSVMPSYFCDVMTSPDNGGDVIRLMAVPKSYDKNPALNTLVINEGKIAKKSGQIVTESIAFANSSNKVGGKITFAPMAGDTPITDLLNTNEFTIVGKAETPLYISFQRGTTTIGDGKIDEYMYICADDFKIPRYTELYVKADFSDTVSAFSDEYEAKIEKLKADLQAVTEQRGLAFDDELEKAKADLAAARTEYETQKSAAQEQLSAALAELAAGEEEYNAKVAEGEAKLGEAQEQIAGGEQSLAQAESAYNSGVSAGQAQLSQGQAQLSQGQAQLNSAKTDFNNQIAGEQSALDNAPSQPPKTPDGFADLIPGIIGNLTQGAQQSAAQIALDAKEAIGQAQLALAQAQLYSGGAQLAEGQSELAVQQISGQQQLSAGKAQLDAAKSQYESGKAELEAQKQSGAEQLAAAREEYNAAKAAADEKLGEALRLIEEGEAALEKLSPPTWYVFTRDDNPGYHTYTQNADRLDAVASVFPLFFLLVAVLVCVTTMTRLIEEKRTEIATLKALGYSDGSIILKYIIYSMIAAVTGSAVGVAAGVSTLPFIIYDAYKIMFYIGDIDLVIHVPSIVIGMLAAVVCTAAVSVIVCAKSLRAKPAQAMRPKAPKPGKRILLERVAPLWRHMGFTAKLTARNLFRYKVRLCMTVIGVAGCTALIVAAFGLLNSFDPLTEAQFGDIFKYDAVVIPKAGGDAEELAYLKTLAQNTGRADAVLLTMQEEVTLRFKDNATTESTYISVPEDTGELDNIISLHTRKDKTPLSLTDDSVLLNEKLAAEFGISAGDTVELATDNGTAQVKVGGIYEQYVYNYVFMTPQCYQSLFAKPVRYNLFDVRLTDKEEATAEAFSSAMLKDARVTAISYMNQTIEDFRKTLNSLNMVVVVMVVCAAALAFVVLYNLTNINIAERVREIATFKVLGFFNRETSRFIYIENIILTLLGILVGLGLGVLLTEFIVGTVEIDNIMFGRDIYLSTYLYAAGLTMLFSLLVNAAMSVKIRKVNMVESLKSVE